MKSVLSLMTVDLKMVLKNIFFWVLVGMLIVIVLVVNFLLPQKIETNSPDIVTYGFEATGYKQAGNIDELKELAAENKNIVGVILENERFTVLANHYSEKQAAAVVLPFSDRNTGTTQVLISQTGNTVSPPPFNKRCLPVFICFEAVVQGFLLAGVLMLNEKSGKIVRALQISPLHTFHYWLAKILLFSVIGSLYALFMAVFTVGLSFSVIPFILVSMIASAIFTMIGIITAVFFRSLNNWFMLASLILGINMLTMFAYIFPSLSLPFMRLIPSYPFIFIFEQILFGSLKLTSEAISIIVWLSVLSVASLICIKNKFLRPQKGV